MKTTVTLDPDVESLLRTAMRERDSTFKEVLNEGLRVGLAALPPGKRVRFKQRSFNMGLPLVDLTNAGALAEELEDQEHIARLRAGLAVSAP